MIKFSPHEEIGSHTFSHYFCLEKGQDVEDFRDDMTAFMRVAQKHGLAIKSLIFPRNQFNDEYVSVCEELGIGAYRGNESSWPYRPRLSEQETRVMKALRLVDSYINISGHNAYAVGDLKRRYPFNIPSSRFLRPYEEKLRLLEPLRLRRILCDITYAARKGLVYHLWWHPHNFGVHTDKNISFLRRIIEHYARLREDHGMQSLGMREMVDLLRQEAVSQS